VSVFIVDAGSVSAQVEELATVVFQDGLDFSDFLLLFRGGLDEVLHLHFLTLFFFNC